MTVTGLAADGTKVVRPLPSAMLLYYMYVAIVAAFWPHFSRSEGAKVCVVVLHDALLRGRFSKCNGGIHPQAGALPGAEMY